MAEAGGRPAGMRGGRTLGSFLWHVLVQGHPPRASPWTHIGESFGGAASAVGVQLALHEASRA
eukprot:7230415-Pyramimonas_sp.AAC.1